VVKNVFAVVRGVFQKLERRLRPAGGGIWYVMGADTLLGTVQYTSFWYRKIYTALG
jgi:hypothetical protein